MTTPLRKQPHALVVEADGTCWRVPNDEGRRVVDLKRANPQCRQWVQLRDIYGGEVCFGLDCVTVVHFFTTESLEALADEEETEQREAHLRNLINGDG